MDLELAGGRVRIAPGPRVHYRFEYELPDGQGVVVVDDAEVLPSRGPGPSLECRAEGLWFAAICETPDEHWTFGLEAFGLRFDTAAEAAAGGFGERLAVGYDLDWLIAGPDGVGRVFGEVLVASDVHDVDGPGRLRI